MLGEVFLCGWFLSGLWGLCGVGFILRILINVGIRSQKDDFLEGRPTKSGRY